MYNALKLVYMLLSLAKDTRRKGPATVAWPSRSVEVGRFGIEYCERAPVSRDKHPAQEDIKDKVVSPDDNNKKLGRSCGVNWRTVTVTRTEKAGQHRKAREEASNKVSSQSLSMNSDKVNQVTAKKTDLSLLRIVRTSRVCGIY